MVHTRTAQYEFNTLPMLRNKENTLYYCFVCTYI